MLDKKLEKINKETIKHLMTVLYCMFDEADAYMQRAMVETKEDNKYWDRQHKKWDEAEKYLRDYINNK